jgi:hypothetical protein
MKNCLNLYAAKYPKAMMRLEKDQEALGYFMIFLLSTGGIYAHRIR